jgi:hypothetical protein
VCAPAPQIAELYGHARQFGMVLEIDELHQGFGEVFVSTVASRCHDAWDSGAAGGE